MRRALMDIDNPPGPVAARRHCSYCSGVFLANFATLNEEMSDKLQILPA